MVNIFTHTDDDGDELGVRPTVLIGPSLMFDAESGAESIAVRLNPPDVNRLHAALGAWMAQNNITVAAAVVPAEDPEPIYRALVRRLVSEEVQRVMPLHWSPQAAVPAPARCDGTACCGPHPVDPDALRCDFDCSGCHAHEDDEGDDPVFCTIEGCDLIPDRTYHLEHDPEPQDVGHPAEPVFPSVHLATAAECQADREGAPCIAARHLSDPNWSDALWTRPVGEPEPDRGRLMAELPRRKPLASLYCDGCRHLWSDHGLYGIRGCHAEGPNHSQETGAHCECSRVQPRSE